MTAAAHGRPCLEMGSRRAHEEAAVAAARAAIIAGFSGTSNLEAGYRYGVPTIGTSAHAFTLLHDTEEEAFAAQVAALGTGTTLLVDTYDVTQGVTTAIKVAGTSLGAVRLDSGDLGAQAHTVREQLDRLGAHNTTIIVTSDLDEYAIAGLQAAPVDGYGVGTKSSPGQVQPPHPWCTNSSPAKTQPASWSPWPRHPPQKVPLVDAKQGHDSSSTTKPEKRLCSLVNGTPLRLGCPPTPTTDPWNTPSWTVEPLTPNGLGAKVLTEQWPATQHHEQNLTLTRYACSPATSPSIPQCCR